MENINIEENEFSRRLKYAMNIRGVNASTLSEKTNISKPLISNYLSGGYKAKQDKLYSIAVYLNVSPSWLMGYDVPMEDNMEEITAKEFMEEVLPLLNKVNNLSDKEKNMLKENLEYVCFNKGGE